VDAGKIVKRRGLVHEAHAIIQRLYAVKSLAEQRAEEDESFTFDDCKALRLEKAKMVLDKFKQRLGLA